MNEKLVSTINGLKALTNNGAESFNVVNVGGVFEERVTFQKPISPDELGLLRQFNLPADYYDLLTLTNGLSLFEDKFNGLALGGAVCEIYNENTVLRESASFEADLVPILYLRDLGVMCISQKRYLNHQNYLTYPGIEAAKFFKVSFADWLIYFIACNGNQFWNL